MRLTGNSVVCERCGSRIVEQDWGNGGRVWADQSDGRAHSDVRCLTGRVLSLESENARLRKALTMFMTRYGRHCGLCCRFDADGHVITPDEACVCEPMVKLARAALATTDQPKDRKP